MEVSSLVKLDASCSVVSSDGQVSLALSSDVTTDEWAFYLLPLDDDILSLELPEFFRDNFLVRINCLECVPSIKSWWFEKIVQTSHLWVATQKVRL